MTLKGLLRPLVGALEGSLRSLVGDLEGSLRPLVGALEGSLRPLVGALVFVSGDVAVRRTINSAFLEKKKYG